MLKKVPILTCPDQKLICESTDHMHHTCLIPIWIVVYRRQWLYLMLCISRILPGGDIFSLDIKIYLYLNICAHSVAESKTRDLVIVFIVLQGHSGT